MATTSQLRQGTPFDASVLAELREWTLAKHPLFGGLLMGLSEDYDRVEERRRWKAEGAAMVTEALTRRARPGVYVLNDVEIPGAGTANHVIVGPAGVWVVDVHRYRGRVEVRKPLRCEAMLRVAGRDKTSLSHELAARVAVVEAAVTEHLPKTPVRGVLCFVDAELPLLGNLTIDGQQVLTRKTLARRATGSGSVSPAEARALVAVLGNRFATAGSGPVPGSRMLHAA